jgi:hypothetical protein
MSNTQHAFELFDAYNKQDPNQLVWNGETYPAEYFYALQLHSWVRKLEPGASEILLLASRAQHIGRWKTPRDKYPAGKAGYLTWRKDLAKFHSQTAGELMLQAGFGEHEINGVRHIILKENLKFNHEVQVMENALCLVFLEFQYDDFILKHDDEKVIRILKKSWLKMTEPGREAALGLNYSHRGKELIVKAIG